jgi:NADH dehydrogenase [ubiquinone] 1 alpha subcomplex assembly factor 1
MLLLLLTLTVHVMPASPQPDSVVLVDFARAPGAWSVVNDGVMGGVSSGTIGVTADGVGVFAGRLSLENNGGFASVRTDLPGSDLAGLAGLALRVRGDGREYQVRLHTDGRFDGIAYAATFRTEPDRWLTVVLPFDAFVPTYRGYTPRNAPPLDPAAVRQLGLLIGDKRDGPFRLEIERIVAVRDVGRAP